MANHVCCQDHSLAFGIPRESLDSQPYSPHFKE